jgi:hypothetical protein
MAGRVTHRAARSCPAHGAASGAVDNPTSAKPHLTKSNSCPTKRGHLWYYDDKAWTGVWSARPEGYVDSGDMKLSDTDLMLNLIVDHGKVGGDLSTKAICKINPMFDYLMLEGDISGDTATITAFDFIGGKRENFFRFTAKREGVVMNVELKEGFIDWIPRPVRIARHPDEGEDPYANMPGLCADEKGKFMKQIRPSGLEKGVRKPLN